MVIGTIPHSDFSLFIILAIFSISEFVKFISFMNGGLYVVTFFRCGYFFCRAFMSSFSVPIKKCFLFCESCWLNRIFFVRTGPLVLGIFFRFAIDRYTEIMNPSIKFRLSLLSRDFLNNAALMFY